MGLSNEVISALVAQGLPSYQRSKLNVRKKDPGLEPGLHSSGEDRAERQDLLSDLQL